ncbi:hypothetical protein ABFS82_12G116500 [Erythranthe guttata]
MMMMNFQDEQQQQHELDDSYDYLYRIIDEFKYSELSTVSNSSTLLDHQVDDDEEEEISSTRHNKNPTYNKLLPFCDFDEEEEQFNFMSQPLIRPIWFGSFSVIPHNNKNDSFPTKIGELYAGLSIKSLGTEIHTQASKFKHVMRFDLLPKCNVWPKSFRAGSGPTEDNIAVYFFPMEQEKIFDQLMFEMIRDDLAMRALVENT